MIKLPYAPNSLKNPQRQGLTNRLADILDIKNDNRDFNANRQKQEALAQAAHKKIENLHQAAAALKTDESFSTSLEPEITEEIGHRPQKEGQAKKIMAQRRLNDICREAALKPDNPDYLNIILDGLESEISQMAADEAQAAAWRDQFYTLALTKALEKGGHQAVEAVLSQRRARLGQDAVLILESRLGQSKIMADQARQAGRALWPLIIDRQVEAILNGEPADPFLTEKIKKALDADLITKADLDDFEQNLAEARAARKWTTTPENLGRPLPELLRLAEIEFYPQEGDIPENLKKQGLGDLICKTLKTQIQSFQKDPIGFIDGQRQEQLTKIKDEGVIDAQDHKAMFQTEAALGHALAALVGGEAYNGQVLSRKQAAWFKAELELAKTTRDKLGRLAELEDSFGPYTAKAFEQIGVSPAASLVATIASDQAPKTLTQAINVFESLDKQPKLPDETILILKKEAWAEARLSAYGLALKKRLWTGQGRDHKVWRDLAALYNVTEAAAFWAAENNIARPRETVRRLISELRGDE